MRFLSAKRLSTVTREKEKKPTRAPTEKEYLESFTPHKSRDEKEEYHRLSWLTFTRSLLKAHIKMGIKGLPEQLKHYYRDAQVEQFKGTRVRIFKITFASPRFAWFPVSR